MHVNFDHVLPWVLPNAKSFREAVPAGRKEIVEASDAADVGNASGAGLEGLAPAGLLLFLVVMAPLEKQEGMHCMEDELRACLEEELEVPCLEESAVEEGGGVGSVLCFLLIQFGAEEAQRQRCDTQSLLIWREFVEDIVEKLFQRGYCDIRMQKSRVQKVVCKKSCAELGYCSCAKSRVSRSVISPNQSVLLCVSFRSVKH